MKRINNGLFISLIGCAVTACGGSTDSNGTASQGGVESSSLFESITLIERGTLSNGNDYLIVQDFQEDKTFIEYASDSTDNTGKQITEAFAGTWDISGNTLTIYYSNGESGVYSINTAGDTYLLNDGETSYTMTKARSLSSADVAGEYQLTFAGMNAADTLLFASGGGCEFVGFDSSSPCEWSVNSNGVMSVNYPGYSESDKAWLIGSNGQLAYMSEDQLTPLIVNLGIATPVQ